VRFGYPVKQADGSFKFAGKGLEEILQPVSKNIDDALLYFVGKSARRTDGTRAASTCSPRGKSGHAASCKTPEREKAFAEYQEWNKGVLDFAEAQGVINPEARRLWQRTQYLPFHRVEQPGGIKGKPGDWAGVQALTGGTTNIKDVLGNMIGNAAMLIDKSVKNEARRKIANLSQKEGGGQVHGEDRRPARPGQDQRRPGDRGDVEEDTASPLDGDAPAFFEFLMHGTAAGRQQRGGGPARRQAGLVRSRRSDPLPGAEGRRSADHEPGGQGARLAEAHRPGIITTTPDFWLANIARDTLMGSVMSRSGFRPVLDSLKGMAEPYDQRPGLQGFHRQRRRVVLDLPRRKAPENQARKVLPRPGHRLPHRPRYTGQALDHGRNP
jgi:hypothetical protein